MMIIVSCHHCSGEGRNLGAPSKWGDGSPTDFGPCPHCGGTGEVEEEPATRTLEDTLNAEAEEDARDALAALEEFDRSGGVTLPELKRELEL